MSTGRHIMIDGIDGSGKSTVVGAIREWAKTCNHRIFDLGVWCKEHANLPRFDEVADHDVFFLFEPTRVWVGAAVRQEMIGAGSTYNGLEQAHGFSLDRLILYRRLIIPALAAGKKVISDRGVTTSIVYQPEMPGGPTLEELLALPGNAEALKHRPDDLIIATVPPEKALARLPARTDGDPTQMYERIELLAKFDERYRSDWFAKLFTDRGTIVHRLDTDCPIDEAKTRAVSLISSILTSC